jgi:hypothetical protein
MSFPAQDAPNKYGGPPSMGLGGMPARDARAVSEKVAELNSMAMELRNILSNLNGRLGTVYGDTPMKSSGTTTAGHLHNSVDDTKDVLAECLRAAQALGQAL